MFAQVSRFKVFGLVMAFLACIVMWPASITEANALQKEDVKVTTICHSTGDLELYSIPTYEAIFASDEYVKLWTKLTKEERLVQATTVIKYFKGCNGKLLISHELIAKPGRIIGYHKAPEYITFMTDYQDAGEKFCRNAIDELGFLVRGSYRLDWVGKDMHLIALER